MSQQLVIIGLGCIAAVAAVLAAFPQMFAESRADQRQKTIQSRPARHVVTADAARDPNARRKQVSDSLKTLEERSAGKPTLAMQLAQAGLGWTPKTYWIVSAGLGIGLGLLAFIVNGSPLVSAACLGIGALGMPRWILSHKRKKRFKAFRLAFPEALDMMTRGVKAGLPLNDCMRMIAREANEPVKTEFRNIVQLQGMGLSIGDATEKMAERIPTSESNFFAIVIGIQAKSGGNLSEALGNLSKVLRERKKMEGKIKAMSSEAKASAGIIGCLPVVVGTLVYLTSPSYISLLWTTDTGRMVLLGAGTWMSIGIFTIKKMVSFDF
jgi:tight adherence protein B